MFGVETIEIVFSLIRFSLPLQSCMFNCSSSSFWPFKRLKRRRFKALYNKKKEAGFQPGLPGSPRFRVDLPGRPGFAGSTPHRVFT